MKYLSLFSGIASESVAWKHLNWKCYAHSEINKSASAVLDYHYPNIPNLGDISKINWNQYHRKADLVIGGSPCQSFSLAGLKKGLNDERGKLTLEYCNAIKCIRPRFFIWENVPNVLYSKDNAFGCLLAGLLGENEPLQPANGKWKRAGFFIGQDAAIAYRILDSQYFGVPQRRKRVFLLGMHFGNCGTVDGKNWGDLSRLAGIPATILFEGNNHKSNSKISASIYPKYNKTKNDYLVVSDTRMDDKRKKAIYKDICPTLMKKAGFHLLTDTHKPRKLTPLEFERLQGFPDNYTLVSYKSSYMSNNQRYLQLGNAITVNVLKWLGDQISSVSTKLDEIIGC
jgi:DNA (cytosine-5)-methyltransferase 1